MHAAGGAALVLAIGTVLVAVPLLATGLRHLARDRAVVVDDQHALRADLSNADARFTVVLSVAC